LIIVSACLAGFPCRYDGRSCPNEEVISLVAQGKALPVCPEQLGGLATPRAPVELAGGRAKTRDGLDLTADFLRGAAETARLAKLTGAREAILREDSPSCGVAQIYDGTFSGKLIPGQGLTAGLLCKSWLKVRGLR
jgi:uncharacterized protein YbbK (DUF523 family)